MTKTYFFLFLFVFSLSSLSAFSDTFRIKPEVLAYGSDHGSSPADSLCFVANSRFTPYQDGWLIPFTCLGGPDLSTQLWFVRNGKSQLLQESTQGRLLSKVYSDGRQLAWTEFDEGGTLKLFTGLMNSATDLVVSQEFKMPADWKSTYLKSLGFIESGKIWFGLTTPGEEDGRSVSGEGFWENGNFFRSPFSGRSYFFTAESSTQMVVQKTRLGDPGDMSEAQGDQIGVRFVSNFEPQVVVCDRDGDPQSKVLSIFNSGAVQGDRWAFIATVLQGATRVTALIRGQGLESEIFPLDSFFKSVDFFNPAVLNDGRVVLRATDNQGRYGLWIFDGNHAQLLAGKGDYVQNEHGTFALTEKPFVTSPASSGTDIVIGVSLADIAMGEVMEQDVVCWDLAQ
jgi:hypothetical protein